MIRLIARIALLLILLSSQLAWAQMPPMSDGDSALVVAENCPHHGDHSAPHGKASDKGHADCQHDGQCHCAHFCASPSVPSTGLRLTPAPNAHISIAAIVERASATQPFKPWRPPSAL